MEREQQREQQGGGGAGADETARVAALEARTEARVAEMAAELEEVGVLDGSPKVMGRQMIMMISPRPRTK